MLSPLQWEVSCGDPGNNVAGHFETASEALEFCGKLLYGNLDFLFEIYRLELRRMLPGSAHAPEPEYEHNPDLGPQWDMKVQAADGTYSSRLLETRHELFGMLIAEVKLGAIRVLVHNLKYE